MDEPTILIVTPRRRGRPRAEESGTTLSTWMPASHYDQIVKQANAREMSVSQYVRIVLTKDITNR